MKARIYASQGQQRSAVLYVVHSICTHHIVYHLKNGAYVSLDNFDNLQVRIQKPAAFSSYSEEQELQDVLNSMMQKDCHK